MRSRCATSRPRSARRTRNISSAGIRTPMSTFSEYSSWLVVEAANGFGAATLAAKLLADLGCTVARLDDGRDTPAHDDADDAEAALHELVCRAKDSVGVDYRDRAAAPVLDALLRS